MDKWTDPNLYQVTGLTARCSLKHPQLVMVLTSLHTLQLSSHDKALTLMLLEANLANIKCCKKI